MAKINVNELSREQIEKAMACKTAEELMAAAKAEASPSRRTRPRRTWRSWRTLSWTRRRWQRQRGGWTTGMQRHWHVLTHTLVANPHV